MKLIIKDDDDRTTVVPLLREEISIGRMEGNTIRLTERNVSRKHARILKQSGAVFIEDLGSYNGVRVNGEKITARAKIQEGDQISIGDYFLELEGSPGKEADTNPTVKDGHVPPADKTPPVAVAPPQAVRVPVSAPASAPPAANRKTPDGSTAMIRLSDLARPADPDELRDLSGHETPRIVALGGSLRGKEFSLRRTVVKFGRTDEGNDLVIDHQSISRQHGKFQIEGGAWKIYDNKSANGIRVNGEEYGMSPVKPGDTIELGHVKFRFLAPGEQYTVPREAPAASGNTGGSGKGSSSADGEGSRKGKTGLIIGAVVGGIVLLGVVVGVVMSSNGAPKAPKVDPENDHCLKGQSAVASQNWKEAVNQLSIAKSLASQCTFPLDQVLDNAKKNQDAKAAIEDAKLALEARKFAKAISALKGVAPGTSYESDIKAVEREARERGSKELVDEIMKDIDAGKLQEAKQGCDDLFTLDPDNAQIMGLTTRISEKKKQMDAKAAVDRAPPPPPKKSLADRNSEAEQLLSQANDKIRSGDLAGGIAALDGVIKLDPDKQYVCKAYRNKGVGYARGGKTDEAVENYKKYLQCDPNAPEKDKLQQIIAQHK